MKRKRFNVQKTGTEAGYCGEIDRSKEDTYSLPQTFWDPRNVMFDAFNISFWF